LPRERECPVIDCRSSLKMIWLLLLKRYWHMKRLTTILISAVLTLRVRSFAQNTAQAGAQRSDQTSVQADKTLAQASSSASTPSSVSAKPNQTNASLASRTVSNAALNTPVDSRKAKAGDSVIAHITESAESDGKTMLPKGTKLVGHVTQALERASGDSESSLAITFDSAILRNGSEVPLSVAIQALASAPAGASAQEGEVDAIGSPGTSAAGFDMATSRGTLVGAASATGSAVGTLAHRSVAVGSTAAGAVNSTVHSATGAGGASRGAVGDLNAASQITSNSRGVFGLDDLSLSSETANHARGSVITPAGQERASGERCAQGHRHSSWLSGGAESLVGEPASS
jgi:hypothetical protein